MAKCLHLGERLEEERFAESTVVDKCLLKTLMRTSKGDYTGFSLVKVNSGLKVFSYFLCLLCVSGETVCFLIQ